MKPLEPIATVNIKHSLTSNAIIKKTSHLTKALFTSVPVTQYTRFSFQQKNKAKGKLLKGKEKYSLKGKASIRTRLSFDIQLVIIKQEFKIAMINMHRALMEHVDSMQKQTGNASREMGILRIQKKF